MAMCSDDPCKINSCTLNKDAVCKANFCGGCNAVFYNKDGSKASCSEPGKQIEYMIVDFHGHEWFNRTGFEIS